MTDEELAAGPAVWDAWEDPFAPWEEGADAESVEEAREPEVEDLA